LHVQLTSSDSTSTHRKIRRATLCACIFLLLWNIPVVANELQPIRLFLDDSYDLNLKMWILVDESNSLTIDNITTQEYQPSFKKNTQKILNLGISDSTYWMKVKLYYPSAYPNKDSDKQWLLEIANSSLDIAELFIAEHDGIYDVRSADTRRSYSDREVLHINSVFPLRLSLGQEITLYIRIKNTTSMYIPLTLWTPAAFSAKVATEEFIFGVFFGSMLILGIYNLYIYLTIRDVSYLFYFIYLGGITTFEMLEVGRGIIHIDRHLGAIDRKHIIFFIWITAIAVMYFAKHFVSIVENHRITNKILDTFLIIAFASFILAYFTEYSNAVLWNACFMSIFLPAFSIILIYCWLKGNENAKFLFFAWISNAIGLTLFAGLTYKILPATQLTLVVTFIGIFIEALLLSFALAHRIKREQTMALLADNRAMTNLSQYQSAFDNSMEGRYTMSLNGHIVNSNPAMVDMFGFTSSDELTYHEKSVAKVLFDDITRQSMKMLQHKISSNNITFLRGDGKQTWAIHKTKIITKNTGDISHIEGSIIDVTQINLKHLALLEQDKERKSLAYAESSAKAKSEFLSNMSHEIRTPLTAIIGFSESLKDPNLSPKERNDAVNLVSESSRSLLELINNILDYSKLEAHRLHIENVAVNIFSIVDDIHQEFSTTSKHKGLNFDINYKYPIPEKILGDPLRIGQIIHNLCSNAIKFSRIGNIQLSILWDSTLEKLVFKVSDNGLGITTEMQNNLFVFFEQGDTSSTRQFGGAGLGLAISRKLATMMGGDIKVQSELGKGSEFAFIVGGEIPDETIWVHDKNTLMADKKKNLSLSGTVLLAEDNIVNQKLIEKVLRTTGLHVVIVENGLQACNICNEIQADLILMDINMPIRDGFEATEYLRKNGHVMPIYALTAETDKRHIKKAIKAGCQGVLSKPINKASLLNTLNKHLSPSSTPEKPPPENNPTKNQDSEGIKKETP